MARLRHVNGAVVDVPEEKVDTLLRAGFSLESKPKHAEAESEKKSSK